MGMFTRWRLLAAWLPAARSLRTVLRRCTGRGWHQRQPIEGDTADRGSIPFEASLEDPFLFPTVDRQNAVRRNSADGFGELEVILVLQAVAFGHRFALGSAEFASLPEHAANRGPNLGGIGNQLGQNMLNPE